MKPDLKIAFWNFDNTNRLDSPPHNVLYCIDILSPIYNLIYSLDANKQIRDPDVLFVGAQTDVIPDYFNYKKLILLIYSELRTPSGDFDFAVSCSYFQDNDKHIRWSGAHDRVWDNRNIIFNKNIEFPRKSFCMFMVSNPNGTIRNELFHKLNEYKPVISAGDLYRNRTYPCDSTRGEETWSDNKFKIMDIEKPKFMIAAENFGFQGYVTEKLVDAMICGAIPIYWGNHVVYHDFNPLSFINLHAFPSISQAIEYIKFVDNNNDEYEKFINQPYLLPSQMGKFNKNKIKDKILQIVENI